MVFLDDQHMFCTICCTEVTLLYKMYVVLPPCNDVSMSKGLTLERLMDKVLQRMEIQQLKTVGFQGSLQTNYAQYVVLT